MSALWLPAGVFFCAVGEHGVFLDLNRDEYTAVELQATVLQLEGPGPQAVTVLTHALSGQADGLIEAGLLARGGEGASSIDAYLGIARPTTNILAPYDRRPFGLSGEAWLGSRFRIRVGDIEDFVRAWMWTRKRLAHFHISDTVKVVGRMRGRGDGGPAEVERLRADVVRFSRLRPWFPQGYRCLVDSLALARFLGRRGMSADWVFGVRIQPFSAHCWLQRDGVVLNEDSEYARSFTPIMCVRSLAPVTGG